MIVIFLEAGRMPIVVAHAIGQDLQVHLLPDERLHIGGGDIQQLPDDVVQRCRRVPQ